MAKKAQMTVAQIEAQIAELRQQLIVAKQAEQEAEDAELLRLVRRAGVRAEAVALARRRIEAAAKKDG